MPRPVYGPGAVEDRPRDLLVSGHVNVDRFLRLREFPTHDRTVPVESHRVELGGTAGNIALTASRYGVSTGLVSRLGDDFPEAFWQRLERARIDLRGVERVPGVSTPTAYILEDRRAGQRTLMDQGPMGRNSARPRPHPWISDYRWVHLTTGDPGSQLALLAEARRHGVHATADPGQEVHYRWDRTKIRALLGGSEILFGNRSEIERIAGWLGAASAEDLLAHVPLVIRTEGAKGATAFARTGTIHVRSTRPRAVRSVVGAGDSFRGGFYAAWFEGEALRECLGAGTRAAARWMEGAR